MPPRLTPAMPARVVYPIGHHLGGCIIAHPAARLTFVVRTWNASSLLASACRNVAALSRHKAKLRMHDKLVEGVDSVLLQQVRGCYHSLAELDSRYFLRALVCRPHGWRCRRHVSPDAECTLDEFVPGPSLGPAHCLGQSDHNARQHTLLCREEHIAVVPYSLLAPAPSQWPRHLRHRRRRNEFRRPRRG